MRAIEVCRTAALGGHVEKCDQCDYTRIAYNSCRNRHCPKCQNAERAQWLEDRKAELLPVEYFHVVFTLPEELARIAFYNKAMVYGILFRAAAETLLTIARDPKHLGAEIGFFADPAHLGTEPAASSACALRRSRRRTSAPTTTLDLAAARASFFPCASSRACSAACFSKRSKPPFEEGKLGFFGDLERSATPAAFAAYLESLQTDANGSSTPNRPSAAPRRRWIISAATRTAWPFPTSGCSRVKQAESPSSGKTIAHPQTNHAHDARRR